MQWNSAMCNRQMTMDAIFMNSDKKHVSGLCENCIKLWFPEKKQGTATLRSLACSYSTSSHNRLMSKKPWTLTYFERVSGVDRPLFSLQTIHCKDFKALDFFLCFDIAMTADGTSRDRALQGIKIRCNHFVSKLLAAVELFLREIVSEDLRRLFRFCSQSELLAACRGYQTGRRLGNRGGEDAVMVNCLVHFDIFWYTCSILCIKA